LIADTVISWNGDEPELVVAWLFAVAPTDRALAGWSPQAYVRQAYGTFLRLYADEPPYPPLSSWQAGTAGAAANEAGSPVP